MKLVGMLKLIYIIFYCFWIDFYKCLDVSKIQFSCIEFFIIFVLDGECKMCLFDWCLELNDMVGSGKFYDYLLLDVVFNFGSKELLKLVFVINWLVIGQGEDNVNLKGVCKIIIEILFWNFEIFGF